MHGQDEEWEPGKEGEDDDALAQQSQRVVGEMGAAQQLK